MFKALIVLILFVSAIFALDRPTNYWAGSSASRGDQQEINGFAAYNITSNGWNVVLPHGIAPSQLNGIVSVGGGLLAYGSFTAINGGTGNAAGLAFWDGKVWSAPEGVGVFNYPQDTAATTPRYQVATTGTGTVFAAVASGNDVYILGNFNQVGLVRGNLAGFAKLSWTNGNFFSVSTVGNGYNQVINGACSSLCPRSSQPSLSANGKNKLKVFNFNNVQTFILQDTNNLWSFQPNSASWTQITSTSGARNLAGAIADFDIDSTGNIYVVGKFDNTNDADPARQYLHIAVSNDAGVTWRAVSNPQPLPLANFQPLGPVLNPVNGATVFPGLDATGLTSIFVESANSIYVAGGWRVAERNVSVDNTAGQMQTRVFQIVGATLNIISERFGSNVVSQPAPETMGVNIQQIYKTQGTVFVFGNFNIYRYVVPSLNTKFGQRFTEVIKGAASFVNNQWSQAFGGYLTTTYDGDVSPSSALTAAPFGFTWNAAQDVAYFVSNAQNNLLSSYGLVSGSIFGWGGEKNLNQKNRWSSVLGRQRFVSAGTQNTFGTEGTVNVLHQTKSKDALIIGGQFDFIGSQTIGGVAWYNSIADTVSAVGGGLFYYNGAAQYGQDLIYNNRIGGNVWDFEERGDFLYAAGQFNRNNSGSALLNIASIKFRENGAGWNQVDGGCDNVVRDMLFVGSKLYVTGDFLFCGLTGGSYTGSLQRGRVPTSKIAVIDVSDNKGTWRNLGIGLTGGNRGVALAYRNGQVFVAGDFAAAGGKLNTGGIARWYESGQHWEPVLAKCRGACDRSNNIYQYAGTNNIVPAPANLRPSGSFLNLREIDGIIYGVTGTTLVYFDSNTWYQAQNPGVGSYSLKSNTLISRNATQSRRILIAPATGSYDANGANLQTFDQKYNQDVVTYGGFSQTPNSFSSASSLVYSALFLFTILFAYFF